MSNSSGFDRWLISPVWSMNSGGAGSALILSTAAFERGNDVGIGRLVEAHVAVADLDEAQLTPRRASSCGRIAEAVRLQTPPCITHRAPVPAQAMHFRKPRRSIPSWWLSTWISSVVVCAIILCVIISSRRLIQFGPRCLELTTAEFIPENIGELRE